ncbi:hypothetical protein MRB53_040467 [Persea americana]|nr:hypothetical protein MRB53_040467 [Persea americana]
MRLLTSPRRLHTHLRPHLPDPVHLRTIMSSPPLKRKGPDLASDSAKKVKNASITSFFGQPKPVNVGIPVTTDASTNPVNQAAPVAKKFDKEAWIEKLTPEQKELLQLEIDTLHDSWLPYLADEIRSRDFLD